MGEERVLDLGYRDILPAADDGGLVGPLGRPAIEIGREALVVPERIRQSLRPEFSEVHRPLLHEGVAPLHGLFGLVVEVERGARELGHTRPLLGVGVERLLRDLERGRALREQLCAPRFDLGAQLLPGTTLFTSPIASASAPRTAGTGTRSRAPSSRR